MSQSEDGPIINVRADRPGEQAPADHASGLEAPARPDAGVPPPPPFPVPTTASPDGTGEVTSRKRSRIVLWLVAAVVGVVVISAVAGMLLVDGRSSIHFPDSIVGRSRIDSPTIQGLADGVEKEATVGSLRPQVAFYGTASQPAFMVLAFDDAPTSDEFANFWRDFAPSFAGSSGGSVDIGSLVKETRGSTAYECAPYTTPGVSGSVCVWNDGETFGIVSTYDAALPNGLELTPQVREAVTG